MERHIDNILFTEKYRPKFLFSEKKEDLVFEMILPERYKKRFSEGIQANILLSGLQGSGKTSLAKMLVKQFDHPYLYINCSRESSVDVIREELVEFCTLQSLKTKNHNNTKVVIMDELDGASLQFFKALRASMEEYSHVRFIATCNYLNKIPDALQTRRFDLIDFSFTEQDEKELKTSYVRKLLYVCKNEGLTIDKSGLESLIKKYFPDMGSMLNILQGFKTEGKTNISGEDIKRSHAIFQNVFELIFNDSQPEIIFKIVTEQYSSKIETLLSALFNEFPKYVQKETKLYSLMPLFIIKIAEYQAKKSQLIDPILAPLALIYELQLIVKNATK